MEGKKEPNNCSEFENRIKESFQLVKADLSSLKEKLSAKFNEISERIEEVEKKASKSAIKEEIFDNLDKKINDKFSRLYKKLSEAHSNFKNEMLEFRGEAEKSGIEEIKRIQEEKDSILEKIDEKIASFEKNIFLKLEEKEKETASLKGQLSFLKGRISIIQDSLKKPEEIALPEKEEKDVRGKKIKKLPIEEVKYNKDGVNPGFISKIIDSLAED
jgi:DNA repair exonuclease SbcCD ATPase subunit